MAGYILTMHHGAKAYFYSLEDFVKTMSDTEEWRGAVRRFSENEGDFPYPDEDDPDYDALAGERDKRIEAAFVAGLPGNWSYYGDFESLDEIPATVFRVTAADADGKDLGDCDHDVLYGEERIWHLTQKEAQAVADRLNEAAATLFWGEDEETGKPNPTPVYSVEVAPVDEDDPVCMRELFGVEVAAPW